MEKTFFREKPRVCTWKLFRAKNSRMRMQIGKYTNASDTDKLDLTIIF